jgi:RNA polymerase sigma factor (sigma-70 family)
MRHRLATLFVDIAGSTRLVVRHPPETVLAVVQCFGGLVADMAVAHRGHVKDFEGDRARSPGLQLLARAAEPEALAALSTAPAVEQHLARREMSECVRGYVDQLPPDYRTVVVLSELEELPDREIADILGFSLEAAKIRLHRARARLRQMLEQGCDFLRDERNEFIYEPRPDDVSPTD